MANVSPAVELLASLHDIYREIDAGTASRQCERSTACCRFGVTGREPYVTSIELLAVRRALAARGGQLSPARKALPLCPQQLQQSPGQRRAPPDERTCPLLDRAGRCAVYEARPFGCRTYFCGRALGGQPLPRALVRELVQRLEALAARHQPGGDRARPLSRALARSNGVF
jgi:Fe-S-cluster containining protein